MLYDLTASIVTYNNEVSKVRKVLAAVLAARLSTCVHIIDNSPTPAIQQELSSELTDSRVFYRHLPENVGFGQAHNLAIEESTRHSRYHVILNPDLQFAPSVLEKLFHFMQANPQVGQVLPKVVYEDGKLQSCKMLPRPTDLFCRRFLSRYKIAGKLNREYELDGFHYDKCLNLPNLSGCFMFMRTACLAKTGGFDKRFFMYLEDVDLTRRIHRIAETLFYPSATIIHEHQRGSYNSRKLLYYHVVSAIKYFFKWGWFLDKERRTFNANVKKAIYLQNAAPKSFPSKTRTDHQLQPA